MHHKGLWDKAQAAVALAPWKSMIVSDWAALHPALPPLTARWSRASWVLDGFCRPPDLQG